MKIIDVNLTVGGFDSAGKPIDLRYLLDLMDDYRIDQGVCYHQHAIMDPKDGNGKMQKLAEESKGRLQVCAVLDPILGADNLPGEGTLTERLEAFAPACLRVFPEVCRVSFHPFYWEEILEAANTLGLPLIVDFDQDNRPFNDVFFGRLPQITQQYPNIKFVLIRQGLNLGRRIFPLLQKRNNVYFTMERMLDYLQLEEIEQRCGCDRLLFGSGYPERPHSGALGLALYANITAQSREKILHGNWEAICK